MAAPSRDNPLFGPAFKEALQRLAETDKGDLAHAIARDLAEEMEITRKRIERTREGIARGARTRDKRERFRL